MLRDFFYIFATSFFDRSFRFMKKQKLNAYRALRNRGSVFFIHNAMAINFFPSLCFVQKNATFLPLTINKQNLLIDCR